MTCGRHWEQGDDKLSERREAKERCEEGRGSQCDEKATDVSGWRWENGGDELCQ